MEFLRYRPAEWEKAFASEKNNLLFLLPQFRINIEHIGATAVKNCRSFRNVDILISVSNFVDISTIVMLLNDKEYKVIDDKDPHHVVLVKRKTVKGERITVRVVEFASPIYNRIQAFMIYLRDSYDHVQQYNRFREELFNQYRNVPKYNEAKLQYINSHIDDMFKFIEE